MIKRNYTPLLLIAILIGLPVVLVSTVGNPIPASIPSWHHISVVLAHQIPSKTWIHIMSYLGWIVWVYLIIGLIIQIIQYAFHLIPRSVPFFGLSQAVAQQVIDLSFRAATPVEARQREAVLRGAVTYPRNHTLVERSMVYSAQRHADKVPSPLLHQAKLSDDLIPVSYRNNPTAAWWLDSGIRQLASYYSEQNRSCPLITRVKTSDALTLWVDSSDIPPEPWQTIGGLDGMWSVDRSPQAARMFARFVSFDTSAMARLIPTGIDETGGVAWSWEATDPLALPTMFGLTETMQWLALVPWLDQLHLVTLGAWANAHFAPAHIHTDNQHELVEHISSLDKEITVIVATDEPLVSTSSLGNDPRVVWLGPTIQDIEANVRWLPNSHNEQGLRYVGK